MNNASKVPMAKHNCHRSTFEGINGIEIEKKREISKKTGQNR